MMGRPALVRAALVLGMMSMEPALARAGGLALVESQASTVSEGELRDGRSVAVSPDDAHVYVTASGGGGNDSGTLSVWKRTLTGMTAGSLDFVQAIFPSVVPGHTTVPDILNVLAVAVSSDGKHVYAVTHSGPGGGDNDARVIVFARDDDPMSMSFGRLTFVEARKNGDGLVPANRLGKLFGITLSPDGEHVYVISQAPGLVAVLKRETTPGPSFGKLVTFIETQDEAQLSPSSCGPDCHLRLPESASFSPDGAFLYVAAKKRAEEVGSIVVFRRETTPGPDFGKLEFVENILGGLGGPEKLLGPQSVVVSPELGMGGDKHLYVASRQGNAVHVFNRNSSNGKLTFLEIHKVKGIKGPWGIGIDPNEGRYVYVSAQDGNAVATFQRDAAPASTTFGKLTFLETQVDLIPLAQKLGGPQGLAVAPDGDHVYVAASVSRTLTALATDVCGNGNRGSDEECDDGDVIAGNGCDAECRLELCPATPSLLCGTAGSEQSSLTIKNDAAQLDSKDQLQWKWKRGPAAAIEDFGDPTTSASYVLCVYDGSTLVMSQAAPFGGTCAKGDPCWTKKVSSGITTSYTYKDALATPGGLSDVKLSPGTALDLKTQIKIKGKGNFLGLPTLPLGFPVTVQLMNTDTAVCWTATYSNLFLESTDTAKKFQAKSD